MEFRCVTYLTTLTPWDQLYHIFKSNPTKACRESLFWSLHIPTPWSLVNISIPLVRCVTKSHLDRVGDGPWPSPTHAYFRPAVNKEPTSLWYRYFLTRPNEICFDPRWKIEKFGILGVIFKTQRWLTQPNPDQKILTWTHHYLGSIKQ